MFIESLNEYFDKQKAKNIKFLLNNVFPVELLIEFISKTGLKINDYNDILINSAQLGYMNFKKTCEYFNVNWESHIDNVFIHYFRLNDDNCVNFLKEMIKIENNLEFAKKILSNIECEINFIFNSDYFGLCIIKDDINFSKKCFIQEYRYLINQDTDGDTDMVQVFMFKFNKLINLYSDLIPELKNIQINHNDFRQSINSFLCKYLS